MTIKQKLDTMTSDDVYTLLLFVLYKLEDDPDYMVLSRLIYLFDKTTLLKLCEIFGGTTITIPKISDIEDVVCALNLYNNVDIKHMDKDTEIDKLKGGYISCKKIVSIYDKMKEVLSDYNLTS